MLGSVAQQSTVAANMGSLLGKGSRCAFSLGKKKTKFSLLAINYNNMLLSTATVHKSLYELTSQ